MALPREKLVKSFVKFHLANPGIYDLFKHFASEAINAGMKRISARFIVERIRWEVNVATTSAGWNIAAGKALKINDHHSPYYARMFADDYPVLAGYLEFRNKS